MYESLPKAPLGGPGCLILATDCDPANFTDGCLYTLLHVVDVVLATMTNLEQYTVGNSESPKEVTAAAILLLVYINSSNFWGEYNLK
jgi:hypothetical protein